MNYKGFKQPEEMEAPPELTDRQIYDTPIGPICMSVAEHEAYLEEGRNLEKPMYTVIGTADVPDIIRWLESLPDGTELCIGGPRASECPNAYEAAKGVLESIAERMSSEREDLRK